MIKIVWLKAMKWSQKNIKNIWSNGKEGVKQNQCQAKGEHD